MNGFSIRLFAQSTHEDEDSIERIFAIQAHQNVEKIHAMLGAIRAALEQTWNWEHLDNVLYLLSLAETSMCEFYSAIKPAVELRIVSTPTSEDPLINIHNMLNRISRMFYTSIASLTSISMPAFMYLDEVSFRLERQVGRSLGL